MTINTNPCYIHNSIHNAVFTILLRVDIDIVRVINFTICVCIRVTASKHVHWVCNFSQRLFAFFQLF